MTQNLNILVIDDEANICEGIKRALRPQGFAVDSAASAQAGLEKVQGGSFGLVLLDVMMPDTSGIDLIPAIHQVDPETVCIVITGYATVELAVRAIKQGAYHFLTKPFSVDELILAINQGIEHQRLSIESKRFEAAEAEAKRLAAEKAHLEELDRAKWQFFRLMTHEVQAPLSAIQSYLQLLLEEYIAPDQQQVVLEKCVLRLDEEKKLISDLMELGRLQVIGPATDATFVCLDEILRQVVSEIQSQAGQKNLQLRVQITGNIPVVYGSPKLFKSLWDNLLSNAIKYTLPDGTVTANLRVENNQVVGEVQDTGIGIPAAEQGRLFSEFFRAKNARELNFRGTGLGLVLVKKIVEGAGGTIQVESQEGQGTCFIFSLPPAAPPNVQATPESFLHNQNSN
jgi:two-component system, sensor histidine kinase and response regulator